MASTPRLPGRESLEERREYLLTLDADELQAWVTKTCEAFGDDGILLVEQHLGCAAPAWRWSLSHYPCADEPALDRGIMQEQVEALTAWTADPACATMEQARRQLIGDVSRIDWRPPSSVIRLLTPEEAERYMMSPRHCRNSVKRFNDHLMDALLEERHLSAQCFERHANCHKPQHWIAVLSNPWAPRAVAERALAHALEPGRYVQYEHLLPVLLHRRTWLGHEQVTAAIDTIFRRCLESMERLLTRNVSMYYVWPSLECIAQLLVERPDMPWLDPAKRRRADDVLRRMGGRLGSETISQLPTAQKWLCLQHAIEISNLSIFASPHLIDDIPNLPEQAGVIAARQANARGLESLATDERVRVRQHVARNARASRELLLRLATEDVPEVASQVARNPHVTPEILQALLERGGKAASAASRALVRRL